MFLSGKTFYLIKCLDVTKSHWPFKIACDLIAFVIIALVIIRRVSNHDLCCYGSFISRLPTGWNHHFLMVLIAHPPR